MDMSNKEIEQVLRILNQGIKVLFDNYEKLDDQTQDYISDLRFNQIKHGKDYLLTFEEMRK